MTWKDVSRQTKILIKHWPILTCLRMSFFMIILLKKMYAGKGTGYNTTLQHLFRIFLQKNTFLVSKKKSSKKPNIKKYLVVICVSDIFPALAFISIRYLEFLIFFAYTLLFFVYLPNIPSMTALVSLVLLCGDFQG